MASIRNKNRNNKQATPEDRRRSELAKIHQAKKDLGIDDETYRAMLRNVAGFDSAADLDAKGRRAVLDHLCGTPHFDKGGPGGISYPNRPKNMDRGGSRADQLGKIEALLTVGKLPWSYADAIARKMKLADKVAWVEDDDLYKIITALRKQAMREGWDLSGEMQ